MPPGKQADEAIAELYQQVLSDTSGMTQVIIRHQAEMPLVVGELVVCMERVGRWEGWKVLHRDPMGTARLILRFDAMLPKPPRVD